MRHVWPVPTKGVLSRWGRYELQAKETPSDYHYVLRLIASHTRTTELYTLAQWPELNVTFPFLKIQIQTKFQNNLHFVYFPAVPIIIYLKNTQIDLRLVSWERVTNRPFPGAAKPKFVQSCGYWPWGVMFAPGLSLSVRGRGLLGCVAIRCG